MFNYGDIIEYIDETLDENFNNARKWCEENNATLKEIVERRKKHNVEYAEIIETENGSQEQAKIKTELHRFFKIILNNENYGYVEKILTNKDISQMRQSAYQERTDPLSLRKLRKQALGEWTSEDEKEYVAQIKAISEQIASEFPYNSEEPNL